MIKEVTQEFLSVVKSPAFWSFTALTVACAYVLAH